MNLRRHIAQAFQTDTSPILLLTLLAAATRWFFFAGQAAVPFEIQDEILLLWALKDFVTGNWDGISYPVTRFVASFVYIPFFGVYFAYQWLIGEISGLADVVRSFLLYTSHATDAVSVWVWVPRFVSWLSLTISVPLQFVLVRRSIGNKSVAVLASVLLNFSFIHLSSSFFGLPDGLGLLVFQAALMSLLSYASSRTRLRSVIFCALISAIILVRLQNALALLAIGLLYLILVRVRDGNATWSAMGKEAMMLAGGSIIGVVILNPLVYLSPGGIVRELSYAVTEWAPSSEWDFGVHVAYLTRVIFDEVLGLELTALVGASVIMILLLGVKVHSVHRYLFIPLFVFISSMAYFSEMSYETAMMPLLVPASILGASIIMESAKWIQAKHLRNRVLGFGVVMLMLSATLANPIQDWLSLRRMAVRESTRSRARYWIHENIPQGSYIYIAPYTYSVPLIESVEHITVAPPGSDVLKWRMETLAGYSLSPSYHLVNDLRSAVEHGAVPEYYVRTSIAHLPDLCLWEGGWAKLFCSYDPLRGSFPHFSQVDEMPETPPDPDMLLLRSFSPLCPHALDENVYINYRTNVLRNNVRHLCTFGPIIDIYRLSGNFSAGLTG